MMTGELIWGQSFIDEMYRPHRDPEIRKMEEQVAEITGRVLLVYLLSQSESERDCLPEHYRKIKIGSHGT
jgi:hypothetical protein